MNDYMPLVAAGVSVFSSAVMALIAWGLRGEVATLRGAMATLKETFRADMAEAEGRFYSKINGSYVRKEVLATLTERLKKMEARIDEFE